MKLKDKFTITITAEDVKMADNYGNCTSCLVATALKRRLKTADVSEAVDVTFINGSTYLHEELGPRELHRDVHAKVAPFYKPEVIGKRISFKKRGC